MAATDADPADLAKALRRMLDAIDAGDVAATETERAYLLGAVEALERLAGEG